MVQLTTSRSIADLLDIIYHVISHLDPGGHSEYEDVCIVRQALARLARTCRDFTRPALKTLWRHLPDDQPLAELLCTMGVAQRHRTPNARYPATTQLVRFEVPTQLHPSILTSPSQREAVEKSWKSLRGYDDQYTLCHSGDPSAHSRWKDFEAYASYVRAIALFGFDGPKWSELWQELVSCLGPRLLLPNLQSVSLKAISTHKLTADAFLLVSPSVTTLHFALNHDIPGVRTALPPVFDRAPSINTLRLSTLSWEGMHASCPHLRRIIIDPPLDGRRLEYLTHFFDLRSLSISLAHQFASTDQITLLSLDTLSAKGKWTCLTSLLTATHAQNLRVLSLEAWEAGTPAKQVAKDVTDCLHAISAHHASLTSLTVQASYGRGGPLMSGARFIPMVQDTFEGPLLDIARPLLALPDLRTLALVLPDYLDLDCPEGDLRAMAEAWRDLEELHVEFWEYFAPAWVKPPREERARGGPFGALDHFARNCPRLRTLHLPPMDATRTPTLGMGGGSEQLENENGRLAHGLERLIVSKVKISPQGDSDPGEIDPSSDSQPVAQFVGRVFPKAAWAFRTERLAIVDGWAVADDNATCLASANVNNSVSSISSVTMRQRNTENPGAPEVIEKYLVIRFSRQ